MRQRWLSLVAVAAVVALASAGCDRPASSITGPTVAGPQLAFVSGGYATNGAMLLAGAGNASQTRSAVIGVWGGKINFGATSLNVPAGAVSHPTRFTFVLRSQPYIAADLSATDTVTKTVVEHFPVPLTLTLSYAGSKTSIPDPSKLMVFYVKNGVAVEALAASPDVKGKKLVASVIHFSEYSPGWGPTGDGDQACGTLDNPCP